MAITLKKKKEIVESVVDKVKNAGSTVIVGFKNLKLSDVTPLRKNLRGQGIGFTVAKKTLLKRAFGEVKVEGAIPSMDGQVAIAYGEDQIVPVKSIAEAQKKYKDSVYILGGILDGRFLSKDEMVQLSKVPGREVLYSQLLNVMNSPIQGFAGTLNGVIRNFVSVLAEVAKKR